MMKRNFAFSAIQEPLRDKINVKGFVPAKTLISLDVCTVFPV